MNIFYLDHNPVVAAQYLCDKHVVKMVLETAQMICTSLSQLGVKNLPYKPAYSKHPCTIWTGKTQDNFNWVIAHGLSIGAEYTLRYNKTHKSEIAIKKAIQLFNDSNLKFPDGNLISPALAMPDQYKDSCPVISYRNYYLGEKAKFATWRQPRSKPYWFTKDSQ